MITLSVEHETHYDYHVPVDLAHHEAYLRPLCDERQQVEHFEMHIEPAPSHHSCGTDRFNNTRAFFTCSAPHADLWVHAHSRVKLALPPLAVQAVDTRPWESVRESLRYEAGRAYEPATEFVMPSPYVPLLPALRQYAAPSFSAGRPVGLAALHLMRRIHTDFHYDAQSTEIGTPLLEVLNARRGVCQDFAHLLIGALRSMGLAARYVSGYLLTMPAPGTPALVGADASHAWVAAWCPSVYPGQPAWLELDPTNDLVPELGHVRLAQGRDYGDVTPLRGVIRGGGEHLLHVRVTTQRV
jgi:transglutaminase-like putative cysteine protease